jgi:hypothetical protein
MKDTSESLGLILEKVGIYAETSIELAKLKTLKASSHVASTLISRMSVLMLFLIGVLILSIGSAFLLGEHLGYLHYGFFIVAGFYLVLGLIIFFFLHKPIKKAISNLIIKQALE